MPDIDLKESMRVSNWVSTTDVESVAIHDAVKKVVNSSDICLFLLTARVRCIDRLIAVNPDNMVTRNIFHQSSRL